MLRRELKCHQMEAFFARQAPTSVVLEACGGSHHLARLLSKLGHRVMLIPPQYVKPFVKRAKNDRNDAEAISEAAGRPCMRSVAVKTLDQQAEAIILKHREMLVGQRTRAINALRGHAMEFGVVAPKGTARLAELLVMLAADTVIPAVAREMFVAMGAHIDNLDGRLAALDPRLLALHKAHPVSRLLAEIPGVGSVIAVTMALTVDPKNFASGRHFAASLGLTPKEHSTGGKQRMGRISKAGNERLELCWCWVPPPSSGSPDPELNRLRHGF